MPGVGPDNNMGNRVAKEKPESDICEHYFGKEVFLTFTLHHSNVSNGMADKEAAGSHGPSEFSTTFSNTSEEQPVNAPPSATMSTFSFDSDNSLKEVIESIRLFAGFPAEFESLTVVRAIPRDGSGKNLVARSDETLQSLELVDRDNNMDIDLYFQ